MSDDFTKVRMIHDKDYAHYRSHECSKCGNTCNKDRTEINDALNKKYSDSILSDETSTTEHPAELTTNEVEQDKVNHAGVPPEQSLPAGTHDEANSFVDDNQDQSNNAERVISNQQELSTSLDEVSSRGNNVDVAKNTQQVSTTLSAVNLTPPPIPDVIAQKYNCTPAAKSSPGKPVSDSNDPPYLPFKCWLCSNYYSTFSSVKRHVREKHPNSAASTAQQPTAAVAPVIPQPTAQSAVPVAQPELFAIDGTPLNEMNANDLPLPHDDDFDLIEPISVKAKIKSRRAKKKSGIELTPENVMAKERSMRKRKKILDSDEDEEDDQTPEKYNKIGRGGNFYSSWD